MAGQHHALMKDADDGNTVFALTVDDNMGPHQIGAMRCGQIFPLAPQFRIVARKMSTKSCWALGESSISFDSGEGISIHLVIAVHIVDGPLRNFV